MSQSGELSATEGEETEMIRAMSIGIYVGF